MKTIEQTLEELLALKDRTRFYLLVFTAIEAAAALLGFLYKLMLPALILAAGGMIFYFLLVGRLTKKFGYGVNRANLLYGFSKPLKNVSYQEKDGFSYEEFTALSMLPVKKGENTLMSRNSLKGEGFGLSISAHELTFHYLITNERGKTDMQFVSGSLFVGEGRSGQSEEDWLLVRRDLIDPMALLQFTEHEGYRKTELSQGDLSAAFDCYTHTQAESFPEVYYERIMKLGLKAKNLSCVRIMDGKTAVFLTRRFYAGSRYTNTEPTKEILSKNYFTERDDVFSFLRDLTV